MYLKFLNRDPGLPDSWKKYFIDIGDEIEIVVKEINGPSWSPSIKKIDLNDIKNKFLETEKKKDVNSINEIINKNELQKFNTQSIRAVSLIRSYRQRGHLIANLDPLEIRKNEYLDELHPESYGFKKEDYDTKIYLDGIINRQYSDIREILGF